MTYSMMMFFTYCKNIKLFYLRQIGIFFTCTQNSEKQCHFRHDKNTAFKIGKRGRELKSTNFQLQVMEM